MKGYGKLLAIALCLAMLLAPTAFAEQAAERTAHTLRIYDPVVSVNGMALVDLTGATLEGTLADTDEGVALALRLLGGEETAAEGVALFDGRQLSLGATGLSDHYVLPLEKMLDEESLEMLSGLTELLSGDALGQLAEALLAPFGTLAETVLATEVDEGVQTIDFATGAMQMQGVSYTVTGEALETFVSDLEAALRGSELVTQYVGNVTGQSVDAYNLDKADATQALPEEIKLTLWMGVDDPSCARIEVTGGDAMNIVADGYTQEDGSIVVVEDIALDMGDGVRATAHADAVMTDGSMTMTMTEQIYNGDEAATAEVELVYYALGHSPDNPQAATLEFNMTMNDGGEMKFFSINAYDWPADGVDYDYDEYNLVLSAGTAQSYATFDLLLQARHDGGQDYYYGNLSIADPSDTAYSFTYEYQGTYEQNALGTLDRSGALALACNMGYGEQSTSYQLALGVDILHTASADANIPALSGEGLDAMSLGEKDLETLMNEAGTLSMRALGVLGTNVSGLSEILANSQM